MSPVRRYVGIFQGEDGHYGELDLGGSRFALAGEFSWANEQGEQEYLYVAYYVDSGATSEQQEALRKILTGPAFAPLGEPAEVEALPISVEGLESFGQVAMTYGGTVGEIAQVNVTPIEGARSGEPHFSFEGTSGESHKFAFSGGGSE